MGRATKSGSLEKARCSPTTSERSVSGPTGLGKDLFKGNPRNLGIIGSLSHSIARRTNQGRSRRVTECFLTRPDRLAFVVTQFSLGDSRQKRCSPSFGHRNQSALPRIDSTGGIGGCFGRY